MKQLSILGSTGSIGCQTLEVVRQFPDHFAVSALSCQSNITLMKKQVAEFRPRLIRVNSEQNAAVMQEYVREIGMNTDVFFGREGNIACATESNVDIVVAAMVGVCGLEPVVEAIKAGKDIALANKETLVAGGSIVMPLLKSFGSRLLPVDSEHSAVWQCLQAQSEGSLDRILLTASGGPFRGYTKEQLSRVTREEALSHPTWKMGGKITVDSSTMMNKGLEIIEASWLFDISVDQIDVVIHPQSIIHSMVRLIDGSVLAQMGHPDMMLPIQVALFFPDRSQRICRTFDPISPEACSLTFESCDLKVFSCLELAYHAGRVKGSLPVVMNSANEEAVSAFLAGEIPFLAIEESVRDCMRVHERQGVVSLLSVQDVFALDEWSRRQVRDFLTAKYHI